MACRVGPRICNITCKAFHMVALERLLQEESSPSFSQLGSQRMAPVSSPAPHFLQPRGCTRVRMFFLLLLFGMWDLSFATRDWSWTPCFGTAESYPLNPSGLLLLFELTWADSSTIASVSVWGKCPSPLNSSTFTFLFDSMPHSSDSTFTGTFHVLTTTLEWRKGDPFVWVAPGLPWFYSSKSCILGTLSLRKTRVDDHPRSHHSPDLGLSSVMGNYAVLKIFALNRIEWCLKWVKRELSFTLNNLMISTKYCFEKGRKMVKTYSKWLLGCDPDLLPWKSQDGFKTENTWSEINKTSLLRMGACIHHLFIHSANRSFFLPVLSIPPALYQIH